MKRNIKRIPITKKELPSEGDVQEGAHGHKERSREKPTSKFFYIAVIALLLFSGFYFLSQETDFDIVGNVVDIFTPKGPVAATVDGQKIYVSEVEDYYTRVPEPMQEGLTKSVVLDQIITQELLVREAKKLGITVSDAELEKLLDDAVDRSGWTEEEFNQVLSAQGMTRKDLKDLYSVSIVIEKVLNATILENVEVLPYEIEDYYETNIESYRFSDDVVRADHILITNATMSDAEALEVAEMVSSRARTGENFTFLVEKFSEDPTASLNDGNLGYFARGEMVPQFEQAVFELDEGEISDPIRTEFGYHVVRITDIKSAGELRPLSDVYDSIQSDLLTERQQKAVEAYIAELWDEAEIEYMDTEIRPKEVPSDNNETDSELVDDLIGEDGDELVNDSEDLPLIEG